MLPVGTDFIMTLYISLPGVGVSKQRVIKNHHITCIIAELVIEPNHHFTNRAMSFSTVHVKRIEPCDDKFQTVASVGSGQCW